MVQDMPKPVGDHSNLICFSSESTERKSQGLVIEEANLLFIRASFTYASVSFAMLY